MLKARKMFLSNAVLEEERKRLFSAIVCRGPERQFSVWALTLSPVDSPTPGE